MAAINDLIGQIENAELRERIEREVEKMNKQKKFGLVFEEHLPECTPLYDVPVCRGSLVSLKGKEMNCLYTVLKIDGNTAICQKYENTEITEYKVDELVSIAKFGNPIYPCLKPIDSVCNAPDSDLWHTLIEAENYHALQLLEYLYAGQVDCIYIDPPYNTGARDWKYNNNYVDSSDTYRHSKWLSMMQKRLKLAKKLLNPKDSVLIVTIDEKEYLHLGCLLEEMFPEASIQMISIVMNHAGTGRKTDFARINEYAFYVFMGEATVLPEYEYGDGHVSVLWDVLRRSELNNVRKNTKSQFYPIFVNTTNGRIQCVGEPLSPSESIEKVVTPDGCIAVFPIREDGIETMWSCKKQELLKRLEKGYIRVGKRDDSKPQKYSLSYIKTGAIADIENGKAIVEGRAKDGSVQAFYQEKRKKNPPTIIDSPSYDARTNGSAILDVLVGRERFAFPKSLYAVHDCINFFVANKPNALIVDFFAGSGTTLHAVNLLNAEDGGHRRCILVTNNEVSDEEAKTLTAKGYTPGDAEWEKLGIAHYVTWPRTVCSIEGHDVNGNPLKGNYLGSDIPMADGFKANAAFFKLKFLDKNAVALGHQFKEMLPTLWLKAGAYGKCPTIDNDSIPKVIVLPENRFAVLTEENAFSGLEAALAEHPDIETVYIVTDYEDGYSRMAKNLKVKHTYQLYRDYLDNFRINTVRN